MLLQNLPVARSLCDLLEELVQRSGLSYNQLAEQADLDYAHVYRIIKGGRRGSRDAILRLCIALDLEVDEANMVLEAAGYLPLAGRRRAFTAAASVQQVEASPVLQLP